MAAFEAMMGVYNVNYLQAVEAIASLEPRGWRLGLDRMQEFCDRAGLKGSLGDGSFPKFVHVAGTNGKGSTTAYVQSVLASAGRNVGAFFSPYVVDYRERIQVGLDLISEAELAQATEQLWPVGESLAETPFGGATKFEFETALGFLVWKRHQCEWVALEVGLGGRLDATNVVHPRCSVIVSIGLDHVSVLGDTIEKIAAEKAGIVKPGVPVVIGSMAAEAREVIEGRAKELGSPALLFERDFGIDEHDGALSVWGEFGRIEGVTSSMRGTMQAHNAALAVAALYASGANPTPEAIKDGIFSAFVPGRFQTARLWGCDLLFDGAHNREAATVLRQSLDRFFPGRALHLVTNMVAGHDPAGFYTEFGDRLCSVHVVPIDLARALTPLAISNALKPITTDVQVHGTISDGLIAACQAANGKGLVLVTGSNYLVGEVCRLPEVSAATSRSRPESRFESPVSAG